MDGIMNTLVSYFKNLFKDIWKLIKTYPKVFIGIIISILVIYLMSINIDIVMKIFHLCPNGDFSNELPGVIICLIITIAFNMLLVFFSICIYMLFEDIKQYKTLINTLKYIVSISILILSIYLGWKYLIIPLWVTSNFTIFY
jgi:hypothetical protein